MHSNLHDSSLISFAKDFLFNFLLQYNSNENSLILRTVHQQGHQDALKGISF
jgi:hypothetical protein